MSQRTLPEDIERLVARDLRDPHALLGAHPDDGGVVLRAFRPDAERVTAHVLDPTHGAGTEPVELERVHTAGLFEGRVPGARLPLRHELEVAYPDGLVVRGRDAYAFPPTIGELDLHLAGEGRHEELYEKLGAHVLEVDGAEGVAFAVWAPSARSVSVVGDFNSWDGRLHPMRSLGPTGIWEVFLPGVAEGSRYKFEIRAPSGELRPEGRPVRLRGRGPAADRLGRRRARGTSGTTRPGWRVARSATRRPARCRSTRSTWARGGGTRTTPSAR